jgi:hypothetical protein
VSGQRRSNRRSYWTAALIVGAAVASSVAAAPQPAAAQGLFDFLFGGFQRRPDPPPSASSYADPSATPAPSSHERRRYNGGLTAGGGGGGGRSVSYCVRLCDGQHFPIQRLANATPVEMCKAMCPASKTKIFFGSAIDHAVASDGTRYAKLDNAYVYRDRLVPDCTCNGKDAFGLAPLNATSDPTLRPGDIVSTSSGLMAFSGKSGRQSAEFTPIDSSVPLAELAHRSSRSKLLRQGAAERAANLDARGQVTR